MPHYVTLHYILPWSGLLGCPITGRLPKPRARHAPRIVSPSSSHLPASFSPQAHHSQFWGVSKSREVSTFHILTYTPIVLDRRKTGCEFSQRLMQRQRRQRPNTIISEAANSPNPSPAVLQCSSSSLKTPIPSCRSHFPPVGGKHDLLALPPLTRQLGAAQCKARQEKAV